MKSIQKKETFSKYRISLTIVIIFASIFSTGCSTFVRIINEPKVVEEFPEATSSSDPIYYDFIAKYFYTRGDYRQAIFFYEILYKKYEELGVSYQKEKDWASYEIAFCYLKLKNYDRSASIFRELTISNEGVIVTLAEARLLEIDQLQRKIKTN